MAFKYQKREDHEIFINKKKRTKMGLEPLELFVIKHCLLDTHTDAKIHILCTRARDMKRQKLKEHFSRLNF